MPATLLGYIRLQVGPRTWYCVQDPIDVGILPMSQATGSYLEQHLEASMAKGKSKGKGKDTREDGTANAQGSADIMGIVGAADDNMGVRTVLVATTPPAEVRPLHNPAQRSDGPHAPPITET